MLNGGALPDDVNMVVQQTVQRIYVETGNTAEYRDQETEQIRSYSKRNWKEPINLFISVVDPVPKLERDGKQYYTRPPRAKDTDTTSRQASVRLLWRAWANS